MFVADRYHLNYPNDGPIPLDKFAPDIDFILKVSQGRSYATGGAWAVDQMARIRADGRRVGGYHMLDGREHSDGAAEADYFLSLYTPQPGDIISWLDFERSGYSGENLAQAKVDAEAYIKRMHDRGHPCGLYGHADVKAAWGDWRRSGADAWWCPGDRIHADVGPRGPDLWQYAPYTHPKGYPFDGDDFSVVLTTLPLIPQPKPERPTFVFVGKFGNEEPQTFRRLRLARRHQRRALAANRHVDGYKASITVKKAEK